MKKFHILILIFSLFSMTALNGQTWSPIVRLTWNSGYSSLPCIAKDSGNGVHVVWSDSSPGNYEILYKKSTDGGTSWSSISRLSWNNYNSTYPAVAVDLSNGIQVVWSENRSGNVEIMHKRSTNGGTSWSALTRLTWSVENSDFPSIASNSSYVHVVWQDSSPGNYEIFYKYSSDYGSTWSGLSRLTWNEGASIYPKIATDTGYRIHLVWVDQTAGNNEIFYKRSTDGGSTWSAVTRLTWNSGLSMYPVVTPDVNVGIHIVWANWTDDNHEIYHKYSPDSGESWWPLRRLTWNSGNSHYPSVTMNANQIVHVTWVDESSGNSEIYHKSSSDRGTTWSGINRLTWNTGNSQSPSITAFNGTDVHLVWRDQIQSNYEILYKNLK